MITWKRASWWLSILVLLVACNGGGGGPRVTQIEYFRADAMSVPRGTLVTLSWSARNPGTFPDFPSCSLSRRYEGGEAQAPDPVSCVGSLTETPVAPASAGYARYQLNVLRHPYDEDATEHYEYAELTIELQDPDDGARDTAITRFEIEPTHVLRGEQVQLEWHVRNPGTHAGTPSCSLTRRFDGQPAAEPTPIACEGSLQEVPAAPPGAANVRYQLNALKHPYDPADPFITAVVTVTLDEPDQEPDPDPEPDPEPDPDPGPDPGPDPEPDPGQAPPPVSVSLQPRSVTLEPREAAAFTATVTGTSDTRVSWQVTCGDLAGTGMTVTYTAPAEAGTCSVTAISVADASASDSATVTVTEGTYGFDLTLDGVFADAPQGGAVGGLQPRSTFESSESMWLVATITNSGTRTAVDLEVSVDLSAAPGVDGGFVERYRRTGSGAWQRVDDQQQSVWRIPGLPPGVTERLVFASEGGFSALGEQALEVGVARVAGGALPPAIATSARAVFDVVVDSAVLEAQITSAVTVRSVYAYPSAGGSDPHGYASLKRSSGRCGFDTFGAYGADSGAGDHRWACLTWTVTDSQWDDLLDTVIDVRTGGGTPLCSYRLAGTRRSAVLDLSTCGGGPTGAITYRVGRDDGTRTAFGSQQAAHVLPRSSTVSPSGAWIYWPIVDFWQFEWEPGGTYPSGTTVALRMHTLGPGSGGQPQRNTFRAWGPTVSATSGFLDGLDVNDDTHYRWHLQYRHVTNSVSTSYSLSDKALFCRAQGSSDASNCWFAWFAD